MCMRLLDSLLQHSPCWFLDIQFKEYSSSIQALKTEFSRSIQSAACNSAGFAKSVPNFKICAQSLNDFNPILLPIHFKQFQQKFLTKICHTSHPLFFFSVFVAYVIRNVSSASSCFIYVKRGV